MTISNTFEFLEYENEMKIEWALIRKFSKILFLLLMIFTILYFTFFGCFLALNDSSSWAAQTVSLSSEGAANETYPDSMGEYQLARGEESDSLLVNNLYHHKDRENRFLMYNNLGIITLYIDLKLNLDIYRFSLVHHQHQSYREY